jgi:hypothetical protein
MKTQEEVTWRRFTVHEYHRMAEVGILHEDDQVELIEGDIVETKPIGNRNAMCAIRLNRLLVSLLGDETFVSPQNPVRLSEHLGPQPDLAVIRNRDYRESLPRPEDTLFLIGASGPTLSCESKREAAALRLDAVGEMLESKALPDGRNKSRSRLGLPDFGTPVR